MTKNLVMLITSGVLLLILLSGSIFTVDQRQYAIIFQFGEAVRVIDKPGLKVKLPLIQNVEYFDKRIISVDADAKEVTASDEKRIMVNAFARYKITDPIKFYKTVYNYNGMKIRLNRILESSMRRVIGRVPLITLLSVERSNIMHEIRDLVNDETANFGVQVIDVRILRADLPKENSNAIYQRMATDREKEAKQIRAEGQEEAARIKSQADKEKKVILAEAYKKAQGLRGEGDAEATKIYNEAYARDPEFYAFYKSLETYKSTLKKEDTSFILSPDSELLKFLRLGK
ncbi:MAG: Membrane protease subunit, stomatin/prohibitin-like protein [Rickettsiaceae bacterium]|jgi:membrane protease subunit HflC|nr:Membrane protease subunit, stomatin/prohibitin-like protein [Rickettsiaceae bacterium]